MPSERQRDVRVLPVLNDLANMYQNGACMQRFSHKYEGLPKGIPTSGHPGKTCQVVILLPFHYHIGQRLPGFVALGMDWQSMRVHALLGIPIAIILISHIYI